MLRCLLPAALICGLASTSAQASVITTVYAKDSVHFAGLTSPIPVPPGQTAGDYYGDLTDPDVIPSYIDLSVFSGPLLDITAAGEWNHSVDASKASGPEGRGFQQATYSQYEYFGIGGLDADLNMLVGVFTNAIGPAPTRAPAGLSLGDDMTTPLVNQAFAIGASLSNVVIPAGATRLYLGMHDGFEWTNNSGSVEVTVCEVPEPGAVVLAIAACGAAPLLVKRRRSV